MPLVSLCMIMKNEEGELPLVLASARGLADEVVIYDTGSTDRSVAVARAAGATVLEGYWDDDFARARNAALDACSGEWVLWLDADEAIHGDHGAFRTQLDAEGTADAYLVPIESIEGSGLGVRSAFHAARVFRRDRCHWFGPIHEQIGLRDRDGFPETAVCAHLRILHRGYTRMKWDAKDLVDRNLRIARLALEDPHTDHARALFDFGRTLTETDDPTAGLAPLREAADTTTLATVRRAALRTMFHVHLATGRFDDAESVLGELRAESRRTISADVMAVKLLLWRKDYTGCLDAIERLPYAETDEDGFELGRASVAWAKAHALDALGRHGEAADALLDALRTHGQLDEGLGALVGLLQRAGRSASEIAERSRADAMPVLVAMASRLPIPEADDVLVAFATAYPDRLEPLAAARSVAAHLSVPRAMWWSNRLRGAGLVDSCPLSEIARNLELEPLFRLLAAAGGYLAFCDERLVEPARAALSELPPDARGDAVDRVRAVSPELATRLVISTIAVALSRRGTVLDGYLSLSTLDHSPDHRLDPGALPFGDGSVHDLWTEDVLAGVPHDRAGAVLLEWARVVADEGRLRLEVPNLAAIRAALSAGQSARARRLLFGGRRFGRDGEDEANADAWTIDELTESLSRVGFEIELGEAGESIVVSARRRAVRSKRAVGDVPPVCVVIVTEVGASDLRRRVQMLAETDPGVDFETVVLVNGPDPDTLWLLSSLGGDVTIATSPVALDPAAAADEGVRLARADTVVVLSRRATISPGWLARLVAPLEDDSVGLVGAAVVDEVGIVVHAGFDLEGDATGPNLDVVPRLAFVRAESALVADAEVDALGAEVIGARRQRWQELRGLAPGWGEVDTVLDLCLRARAVGLRCVVPIGAAASADPPRTDAAVRERLAWTWAGRAELRAPRPRATSASSLLPTSTLIERITTVIPVPESPSPGGVNLVGDFADARVRPYAKVLRAAGIPVARLQWSGGEPTAVGGGEPFRYTTTVLALDGDQLVDYIAEVGTDSLRGRRTVLAWEWPFAEASATASGACTMVGEIWVPSRFTERALGPVTGAVGLVPPPVLVPSERSRSAAGLPGGFAFAAVARVGRGWPGDESAANPTAVIDAFRLAFAPGAGPTLSVVVQGRRTGRLTELCREAAGGRRDITLVETADPLIADVASVSANCVISLHRASAFGVDLARALAAGRPVIATAFGGPMDYLSDRCADLVAYSPSITTEASFPYGAGLRWAEPDIEAAASAMRSVHRDYDAAVRKALGGRALVVGRYGLRSSIRGLRGRLGIPGGDGADVARRPAVGTPSHR